MRPAFLEIVLLSRDFTFGGRDMTEDALDDALRDAELGEVVGSGTGEGRSNIDVEVSDAGAGLAVVRCVLRRLGVAKSTVINERSRDKLVEHQLYDP